MISIRKALQAHVQSAFVPLWRNSFEALNEEIRLCRHRLRIERSSG
jgi:hypothetical protein